MGEGQREECLGLSGCSQTKRKWENKGEDIMEGREQKGKAGSRSVYLWDFPRLSSPCPPLGLISV